MQSVSVPARESVTLESQKRKTSVVAQRQKMFYNVKAIICRRQKSACRQTKNLGGFYSEKRNCFIYGLCIPDRDRVLCRRSGR